MNTDVSGIGVRVSFYVQTLLLAAQACLSARSNSGGAFLEITSAFYTLIATNMAMSITALILGLKPNPEISFHDALAVFYLLTLSWVTIFFSLSALSNIEEKSVKFLKLLSVVQSYCFFASALPIIFTAKVFGSNPECNGNAVVVLFWHFPALTSGRIVYGIGITFAIVAYTLVTIKDYYPPAESAMDKVVAWAKRPRRAAPTLDSDLADLAANDTPNESNNILHPNYGVDSQLYQPSYNLQIPWDLVIEITILVTMWVLAVMNTELLIRWNRFKRPECSESAWQFGQILPMFLIVIPLTSLVNVFNKFRHAEK